MHYDYDAVVVGARCAGASTAMLLARAGHRVLLVDRATFPSDIAHGHFIHRHGPQRLQRWGLLNQIVASGCPPVTTMRSHFGDFPLVADNLVVDDVAWGYGPRRGVLDKIFIDAAVSAGAELHQGMAVEDVLVDDGTVVGIRARPAFRDSSLSVRARLTIGADGRQSRVARAVNARMYEFVPTLACWYFSYWDRVPHAVMEMHVLPQRRAVFGFPTNDNRYALFVGWPIEEFSGVRPDVEHAFLQVLDMTDTLGERVRSGRRTERFYGSADLPNFLRTPSGPGWALVGDAACHKDPFLALGICDALRDAELLANAAHAGLSGEQPMDAALRGYEANRNAATLSDYRENLRAASFGPPPPDLLQLRAAVRHHPAEATRFVMASHAMIPREEFFNEQHMAQLLGATSAA